MKVFSFIGLGNMGLEMVNHLINQKGVLVNIFDINKKTYNNFNQSNVIKLERIENLPKNTDYYFTMVPDGKILNKIVLGRNGIATKAKKGSIVIDCSSVDYATTINISKNLKKKSVGFLDAPVSGGVAGAKNANLTIMVGGKKKEFIKLKKILELLGKNIVYVGKSGSGQIIKTCNNLMLGINMIGICEAYLLSKNFGIDKKIFFDICSNASGSSWAMLNHLPIKGLTSSSAANNNFKGGYAAKLIKKDLKIAQDLAKKSNTNSILGNKAKQLYIKLCDTADENLDYSSIINYLKKI